MALQLTDYNAFDVTYDSLNRPINVIYYFDLAKTDVRLSISVTYSASNNPIYLGEELKNHRLNIAAAKFDVLNTDQLIKNQKTVLFKNLPVFDSRFTNVNIIGFSRVLPQTIGDVNNTGNFNFILPATAQQLYVVSDDIQDNPAGTGVGGIVIQGLDTNLDPIVDVVFLNGTTPVATNLLFRAAEISVPILGGDPGFGCDGNIFISTDATASPPDNTVWLKYFPNDEGASASRYTVPNGTRFLLGTASYVGSDGSDMTIINQIHPLGQFPFSISETYASSGQLNFEQSFIFLEAGTTFRFKGFTNSGNPSTRKVSVLSTGISSTIEAWAEMQV